MTNVANRYGIDGPIEIVVLILPSYKMVYQAGYIHFNGFF